MTNLISHYFVEGKNYSHIFVNCLAFVGISQLFFFPDDQYGPAVGSLQWGVPRCLLCRRPGVCGVRVPGHTHQFQVYGSCHHPDHALEFQVIQSCHHQDQALQCRWSNLATIRIMPSNAYIPILLPSLSCRPLQVIRSCHHPDHALQFQVIRSYHHPDHACRWESRFATIRIMPSNVM